MMQLPGGIVSDGLIKQAFTFKPVTGSLELSLSDKSMQAGNHSALISMVLSEALESLAGEPVELDTVKSLCVGDRQYLMRQLAVHIDDSPIWLTVKCNACSELFDFSVRHSELPVKPAGKNFPEFVMQTRQGKLKLRVPTGLDQEIIAQVEDDEQSLQQLLDSLIKPLSDKNQTNHYSKEIIEQVEKAIEDMSPEVVTEVLAECPYCQKNNKIPVSPYTCLERPVDNLFKEIHSLAIHYHWSEQEILSMPRSRRLTYLGLIDQSRDMYINSDMFKVN